MKWSINDVPDSLFQLDFKPGTLVRDMAAARELGLGKGKAIQYIVPADASMLNEVVEKAKRDAISTHHRSRIVAWLVWGNVALLAAIALWYVARRLRRARVALHG